MVLQGLFRGARQDIACSANWMYPFVTIILVHNMYT